MGNLIASLDFMLRVALIPRGVINHGEDKLSCIQSERYPICDRLAEKQRLTQACSVLEGIQEPFILSLACKELLSVKPCLHTRLPEHNKSYRKVFRGWGRLITWNGPMMGHLNKNFPKIQMPEGLPGGDVEASI